MSDSDSDSAPEEFCSSAIPRGLSPKPSSPKKEISSKEKKKIKNEKVGSQETGLRSLSQSANKEVDGQQDAEFCKKGLPFSTEDDDALFAFVSRHRDVKQADAPWDKLAKELQRPVSTLQRRYRVIASKRGDPELRKKKVDKKLEKKLKKQIIANREKSQRRDAHLKAAYDKNKDKAPKKPGTGKHKKRRSRKKVVVKKTEPKEKKTATDSKEKKTDADKPKLTKTQKRNLAKKRQIEKMDIASRLKFKKEQEEKRKQKIEAKAAAKAS